MRNAFADEITKLAAEDERVVLLSGDIGNRMFDTYKAQNPERFFNCGVAEANMMSVAAGLALSGLRPVVYTITPFTTTRCLEQIRVGACYHDAPVVIVGTGSGLAYASLGPTHHSCEDMAFLRALPGMTVFAPCDEVELRLGLRQAISLDGPLYMRIGKKGEPVVHDRAPNLQLGHALTVRDGSDVCLIGAGVILPALLSAADRLGERGISARVESFHTVKPLDTGRLEELFGTYPVVALAEEHSKIGGLNGAVSEWLAARPTPPRGRLVSFGTDDAFLHKIGTQEYARSVFGLTADNVCDTVAGALSS